MQDSQRTPLDQQPSVDLKSYERSMQLGATLHAAGQQAQALGAFEQALTHAPQDVNAASACAALLTELKRPAAAYRTLIQLES